MRAIAKKLAGYRRAAAWEESRAWEKRFNLICTTLTTLATKLRLSIQALVDRRSRSLLEGGQQPDGRKFDPLLGGQAIWGAGRRTKAN